MVKNFLGEQEDHKKEKGAAGNGVGTPSFERGVPAQPKGEERTPKNGYDAPANFQDLRNSDPAPGKI